MIWTPVDQFALTSSLSFIGDHLRWLVLTHAIRIVPRDSAVALGATVLVVYRPRMTATADIAHDASSL
jgi:hypothetical protein